MGKTRPKKRILIVEDQLIIALDLELILKISGMRSQVLSILVKRVLSL
jgi:hypothetical protein